MHARPRSAALLFVAALGCGRPECAPGAGATFADVVFENGNIYTNDARRPHAEALAVKNGRIVFVGTTAEARAYEPGARIVDLGGKTVIPGLTDAHVHLAGIGEREATLNLEGVKSLDAFLAAVRAAVAKKKPGDWVTGRGWIETFWTP